MDGPLKILRNRPLIYPQNFDKQSDLQKFSIQRPPWRLVEIIGCKDLESMNILPKLLSIKQLMRRSEEKELENLYRMCTANLDSSSNLGTVKNISRNLGLKSSSHKLWNQNLSLVS